jgi:hypothetical protein
VEGERAGHTAHRLQLGRGDEAAVHVARLPQLGERELEQRQAALGLGRGLDQLIDHGLGLEVDAGRLGRSDDDLADPVRAERTEEEEGALEILAQRRDRGQPAEIVGARGGEQAKTGDARCQSGQRSFGGGGLLDVGHGDQLLQLIDQEQEAALLAELAAQRVAQLHAVGQHLGRLALADLERGGQRDGQRAHRPPARHQLPPRPGAAAAERAVGDGRQHAGAAQRRLAGAGPAGHEHERLGAQAVDHRADLLRAAEEHRVVIELERAQSAVRVATRRRPDRGGVIEVFERVAQLVGRGEAAIRIAGQAAVDDGGEARLQPRASQRRCVSLLRHARKVRQRDLVVGCVAGRQLVHHRAQRVDVRATIGRLQPPHLRCHVVWRAGRALRLPARAVAGLLDHGGQPEVQQLGDAVLRQDGVGRLDVAVHHAAPVRRGESACQLERDGAKLIARDRPVQLVERLAEHVLGDDVRLLLQLADAVDGDDVRVVDAGDRARLEQEALPHLDVRLQLGDELDRDLSGQDRVLRQIDPSHPAAPQRPFDHVIIEFFRRSPVRHASTRPPTGR